MQIKVKHSVQVNRPPAEVFALLSDPDRMPEWQSTNFQTKGKEKANERGRLQKGTKVHDRRNVLGKEIDGSWEVVAVEQDRRLSLRVSEGPVPWEMTYTLEETKGGTQLSAEGGGDLDVKMSERAANRSCQRLLEQDLATLADILEK